MTQYNVAMFKTAFLIIFVVASLKNCNLQALALADSNVECPQLHNNGTECLCGGRPYSPNSERVCCHLYSQDDKVYIPKKECTRDGYTTEAGVQEKCGDSHYDNRYQTCCGDIPIDKDKFQCCYGGDRAIKVPLGKRCCEGQEMGEGDLCCNDTFFTGIKARQDPTHNDCCVVPAVNGVVTTYNKSSQYCDKSTGTVFKNPNSRPPFPGPNAPNPKDSDNAPTKPSRVHTVPVSGSKLKPSTAQPGPGLANFDNVLKTGCLRGKPSEEDGEKLECCGFKDAFRPSQATCCKYNVVPNMPTSESVCCDNEAFLKNDTSNPCRVTCGDKGLNSESELCCDGRVVPLTSKKDTCCGKSSVNPDKQTCCGGVPIDSDKLGCCKDQIPYYPSIHRCRKKTGGLKLNKSRWAKNAPSQFCAKSLFTWDEHWRNPVLPGMVQLRGRVERCGIRTTKNTVVIPLTPAIAKEGGSRVSNCLKNWRLHLVIRLKKDKKCLSKKEAKKYLRDMTLDIFIDSKKLQCKKGKMAKIHLKDGDLALVLMSRKMDTMMVESQLS